MSENKSDIKKKIQELNQEVNNPGFSYRPESPKQKIMRALQEGHQTAESLYKDTTGRIIEYRDKFCKEGHNILRNKKKIDRS